MSSSRNFPIRVGMWNVQCGVGTGENSSDKRARQIAKAAANVDVLLLQEIWFTEPGLSTDPQLLKHGSPGGGSDGPWLVGQHLGFQPENVVGYRLSPSHERPGEWMGVAILSRYPLQTPWAMKLPLPDGVSPSPAHHQKGFCFAQVDMPHGPVVVASGHFHVPHIFGLVASSAELTKSWQTIDTALSRAAAKAPIVVAADFNVDTVDLSALLPTSLGSNQSPLRRVDFTSEMPTRPDGRSTDEILISDGYRITSRNVLPGSPSDHRLCVVALDTEIARVQSRASIAMEQ